MYLADVPSDHPFLFDARFHRAWSTALRRSHTQNCAAPVAIPLRGGCDDGHIRSRLLPFQWCDGRLLLKRTWLWVEMMWLEDGRRLRAADLREPILRARVERAIEQVIAHPVLVEVHEGRDEGNELTVNATIAGCRQDFESLTQQ